MSDSDDERYKQELVKQREEAEARLRQEEEQQWAEQRARKEAKAAEKRRKEEMRRRAEEEEARRKAEEEEAWRKEEERQRDLVHCIEADRVATVEQQRCKNWAKTFLPLSSPPSDKEMNLLNFLPLTKRQRVRYLLQETLESRQRCEEWAKEMGLPLVGGGSPCERCTDFRILCIPQNLL